MEALAEPGRLALTIDIHGHSTKTDAFFYGCEPQLVKPAKVAQAAHHLKTADAVSATATSKSSSNGSCEPACPASLCSMDQLCVMGTSCRASSKVAATEAETLVQLSQLEQSTGHGTQVPAVCECGHSTATSDTGSTVCAMPPSMGSAVRDSSAKQATNSPQSSGCDSSAVDLASLSPAALSRLRVRMLPYLASQLHPAFSYDMCNFKVQKNKAGTARVVAARQLGVPGAYTLEVSLAGASATQSHFGVHEYMGIGKSLMVAISHLAESDDQTLLAKMAGEVRMVALPGHPGSGV